MCWMPLCRYQPSTKPAQDALWFNLIIQVAFLQRLTGTPKQMESYPCTPGHPYASNGFWSCRVPGPASLLAAHELVDRLSDVLCL